MNRRKARELALQILYQLDFLYERPTSESLKSLILSSEQSENIQGFTEELIRGTIENLGEIDRVIQEAAEHWKVERMSAVDRNILRFTVYEIMYRKDIPAAVTINEALEIAKRYSTAESAPFINGLLDKIAQDVGRA